MQFVAGSTQTITWDVAGTDVGAVNTPNVDVLLSIDGGVTFPFTAATGISNSGSESITVPVIGGDTTTARLMVKGSGNIFFSVNTANFTIEESEFVLSVVAPIVDVCAPDDATYNFTYNIFLGFMLLPFRDGVDYSENLVKEYAFLPRSLPLIKKKGESMFTGPIGPRRALVHDHG